MVTRKYYIMKKFVLILWFVVMVLALTAAVVVWYNNNTNKTNQHENTSRYAGTYYSNSAGKGEYANYPTTFIFYKDGLGKYFWSGGEVGFTYSVSNDGTVNIRGFFNYKGKFESGMLKLNGTTLTYFKK